MQVMELVDVPQGRGSTGGCMGSGERVTLLEPRGFTIRKRACGTCSWSVLRISVKRMKWPKETMVKKEQVAVEVDTRKRCTLGG